MEFGHSVGNAATVKTFSYLQTKNGKLLNLVRSCYYVLCMCRFQRKKLFQVWKIHADGVMVEDNMKIEFRYKWGKFISH